MPNRPVQYIRYCPRLAVPGQLFASVFHAVLPQVFEVRTVRREAIEYHLKPGNKISFIDQRNFVTNLRRDNIAGPAKVRHNRHGPQRQRFEDDRASELAQRRKHEHVSLLKLGKGLAAT